MRLFSSSLLVVVDSIRLIGSTPLSGRVEIYHNHEWGTICDDHWDMNEAYVVCRQLGFPPAYQIFHSAAHGQGTGPIWIGNAGCSGMESQITDCSHDGWGIGYCSHSEDASVECSSSIP